MFQLTGGLSFSVRIAPAISIFGNWKLRLARKLRFTHGAESDSQPICIARRAISFVPIIAAREVDLLEGAAGGWNAGATV